MRQGVTTAVPVLSIKELSKSFGGARALDDVALDVLPGEVHGLLGENGSGKSTLIKILAGFHAPDSGSLRVRGADVRFPLPPGQFRKLGMEFVHQDLGLIPALSVVENVRLGDLSARRGLRPVRWRAERVAAQATFARYGVDVDVACKVDELRPVEQALVAIIRGVEDMTKSLRAAGHAQGVLFLDEPTAFLPRDQVDQLFDIVGRIVGAGASVVFVSHDLDEVRRITDRVTVLRNGRNVGTVVTVDTDVDELVRLIVGRDLADIAAAPSAHGEQGSVVVAVANLETAGLKQTRFEVRSGEVLGVTGLIGSGFEEVPYVLFGAATVNAGQVDLYGEPLNLSTLSPQVAIARGMALIPGNRQRDGSIASLSLSENMMALTLNQHMKRGVLNRGRLRRDAEALMGQYDIRPREPELSYGSFSGGNQQKALMAKWLQCKPRVLLLHEPTQGTDVGARLTILNLVRGAAADGAAVICASSDYEQLAMVCDRVLVFGQGRIVRQLVGSELTKESITEACLLSTRTTPRPQVESEVTV
jgi:ribose transport system ATP-binding protein